MEMPRRPGPARFPPVAHGRDPHPVPLEKARQQVADLAVVVHDQNVRRDLHVP